MAKTAETEATGLKSIPADCQPIVYGELLKAHQTEIAELKRKHAADLERNRKNWRQAIENVEKNAREDLRLAGERAKYGLELDRIDTVAACVAYHTHDPKEALELIRNLVPRFPDIDSSSIFEAWCDHLDE